MAGRAGILRFALALFAVLMPAACGMAVGLEGAVASRALVREVSKRAEATAAPRPPSRPARSRPAPRSKPAVKAARTRKPPRVVPVKHWEPFARVGSVRLLHPSDRVERVAFHQASDWRNRDLSPARSAVRSTTLPSRGRATGRRTAADIVVDPRAAIRSPVSGVVKRAGGYRLYCKHADGFVVISPAGHPELEVKLLHITGVRVHPGDRVTAGRSIIARHATKFPFNSQVDAFTADPAWPHVHLEVTQLDVPSAIPELGEGLAFGNC